MALNDIVLDNSSEIGLNNLVGRDFNGDSKFRMVTSYYLNILNSPDPEADGAMILLTDAALFYQPSSPSRYVSNATYRFGLNENVFDYSGGGDGIEFSEHGTHVKIQCSDTAPCIHITSENSNVPILKIEDDNDNSFFEVDSGGTIINNLVLRNSSSPFAQIEEGFIHFKMNTDRENGGALYRVGFSNDSAITEGLHFQEDTDNSIQM